VSAHCLCDWDLETPATEAHVFEMAECMVANRGYARNTKDAWVPGCFAVLSPADQLIYNLAVLVERNKGKVTSEVFENSLAGAEELEKSHQDNLRDVAQRVLEKLGVLEVKVG